MDSHSSERRSLYEKEDRKERTDDSVTTKEEEKAQKTEVLFIHLLGKKNRRRTGNDFMILNK